MSIMPQNDGVIKYKHGQVLLSVFLPEKDPGCRYCPYQRKTLDDQFRCELGQFILFDRAAIDGRCPVIWEGDENVDI